MLRKCGLVVDGVHTCQQSGDWLRCLGDVAAVVRMESTCANSQMVDLGSVGPVLLGWEGNTLWDSQLLESNMGGAGALESAAMAAGFCADWL